MSIIEAIIVGIVQGLTEFIPISSSAHIILAQEILGVKQPGITFEVVVHVGTLFSVFWVFWDDIFKLIKAFFSIPKALINKNSFESLKSKDERNFIYMLIIATIPTGVFGLVFKDFFSSVYSYTKVIGLTLLVTGGILYLSQKMASGYKKDGEISLWDGLIIGFFQSLAIFPGISRSGSTIAGALFRKLDRETAVRFSFILSIPAILGATVLEVNEAIAQGFDSSLALPYLAGLVFSAISGVIAIKWLVALLNKGKMHYFSYYCWVVGVLVLIFF